MLKIRLRDDNKSNFYYVCGTYKTPNQTYKIRYHSTGKSTKNEAEKYLWWFQQKLDRGEFKDNKTLKPKEKKVIDVDYVVTQLLDSQDTPISDERRWMFEKIRTFIGKTPIDKITNDVKEELINTIYPQDNEVGDTIRKFKGKHFKSLPLIEKRELSKKYNTINTHVIRPLSRIISFASENSWCVNYKIKQFSQINDQEREKFIWTMDEVNRCLSYHDFEIKLLLVYLLRTGSRCQEALSMNWDYKDPYGRSMIDMENKELNIFQHKTNSWKNIPIHENNNQLDTSLFHWLIQLKEKNGYLFSWRTQQDKKNTQEGLSKRWNAMLKFANVDLRKKRHSLRHTFISMLGNSGATTNDIKSLSGHKTDKVVFNYAKVSTERKLKLLNSI
jgi:integrase